VRIAKINKKIILTYPISAFDSTSTIILLDTIDADSSPVRQTEKQEKP